MQVDNPQEERGIRFAQSRENIVGLVSRIYQILSARPILYDVKSEAYSTQGAPSFLRREIVPGKKEKRQPSLQWTRGLERLLPQEYEVTREVYEAMERVGAPQVVPYVYALRRTKASEMRPSKMDIPYIRELSVLANKPSEHLEVDALYLQHFEGVLLEYASITVEEFNAVVGYLHHVLAYLKKQIGFAHGNLHPGMILLAGYKEVNPDRYVLPLLDEDGGVLDRIILPFQPILLDLSYSVTTNHSQYTSTSSVHLNELCDIISLYTLGQRGTALAAYPYVKEKLSPFYVEFQGVPSNVNWRLPPYGWAVPGVTHADLAAIYRNQPVYESTDVRVGKLYGEVHKLEFVATSTVHNAGIAKSAKSLLSFYQVDENSPAEYSYVFHTIYNYLQETVLYHGGKVGTPTPKKTPSRASSYASVRTPGRTPRTSSSRTPTPKPARLVIASSASSPSYISDEEFEEEPETEQE